MTIEKAIEILDRYLIHPYIKGDNELEDAAELGIEALKRIKYLQGIALYQTDTALPGETKE